MRTVHSAVLLIFSCSLLLAQAVKMPEKKDLFFGETVIIEITLPGKDTPAAAFTAETADAVITNVSAAAEIITLHITPLKTGTVIIPPITVKRGASQGAVNSFTVTVKENTTEQETQLKEIAAPVKAYEPDWRPFWALGILLLIVAIAGLVYYLIRRRKKEAVMPVYVKTPREIAQEYIRRAEKELQAMEYEVFLDTITAGLRHVMELIEHKPYLEMTTAEVRRALRQSHLSTETAEKMVQFLKLGDAGKFAETAFSEQELRAMLETFKELLSHLFRSSDNAVQQS